MSLSFLNGFYPRRLNSSDTNEVSELLAKFYVGSNNYMRLFKGMTDEEIIKYNNTRVKSRLKQPYSVGVFEESTDKLVAVTLGYVREKKSKLDHGITSSKNSNPTPMQLALNFVLTLEGDLFNRLNVDRIHEIGMSVVHQDYKKFGLMTIAAKLCHHLAKQSGCKYIVTKPVIEYVCMYVEKHNPERIKNEINFLDYVDPVTGVNPFSNPRFPYVRGILSCLDISQLEPLNPPELKLFL